MGDLAQDLKERLYKAVGQFKRETGELPTNFEVEVVVDGSGDFYVRPPERNLGAAQAKIAALPPKKSVSGGDDPL